MNGSVWVSYHTRAQDASVIQVLRGSSECWEGGASISGGNASTSHPCCTHQLKGAAKLERVNAAQGAVRRSIAGSTATGSSSTVGDHVSVLPQHTRTAIYRQGIERSCCKLRRERNCIQAQGGDTRKMGETVGSVFRHSYHLFLEDDSC